MKKTAFVILLIFIGLSSYSQNKVQSVKLSNKYPLRNHSQPELNKYYFGIKPIEHSEFRYYFRHQRDGQIIDIYSKNGRNFSGELINSIIEYKDIKTFYGIDSKADKYIYERVQLNKENATEIGKLILKQRPYLIPTDTLIKGWNFGWLDCGGIYFSYKIDTNYQDSQYTCLWNQSDSIKYVITLKTLYDTISQILNLQQKYSRFESKLGKGKSYSKNGFEMIYLPKK